MQGDHWTPISRVVGYPPQGAGKAALTYDQDFAPVPEQAPKLANIKLIDYDYAKYGASAERRRLIAKWEKEVQNQGR